MHVLLWQLSNTVSFYYISTCPTLLYTAQTFETKSFLLVYIRVLVVSLAQMVEYSASKSWFWLTKGTYTYKMSALNRLSLCIKTFAMWRILLQLLKLVAISSWVLPMFYLHTGIWPFWNFTNKALQYAIPKCPLFFKYFQVLLQYIQPAMSNVPHVSIGFQKASLQVHINFIIWKSGSKLRCVYECWQPWARPAERPNFQVRKFDCHFDMAVTTSILAVVLTIERYN